MSSLLIIGIVFVGLAALVHVFIFYLESIAWSRPATWKRFGLKSQLEADTVKPMALNQGFYNLFLAVGIALGIVFIAVGQADVGRALALFGALSMVAAATVLVISNPKLAKSALLQGVPPLIGSVALLLALAG